VSKDHTYNRGLHKAGRESHAAHARRSQK